MFQVGDFIIYGSNGVCEVKEISAMKLPGTDKNRMYYTLAPIYTAGSKVFTPVDNEKVIMRKVMTEEEAHALIQEIPEIEQLWVPEERAREQLYKNALHTCECRDLIMIIKTLYLRKQERIADGKKVTTVDERYLRMAEDQLYGEIAISLGKQKNEIQEYIAECVDGIMAEV